MRLPAKKLTLPLSILALAVAGCGSSSSGGSGNALDSSLSFVPKDAPFVLVVDTNLDGSQYENAGKLLDKFPLSGSVVEQFEQELGKGANGVSYEQDIKPLLGNPFVIAAVDARSFTADGDTEDFVGAIQAKDGDKLSDVLKKSGAKKSGEQSGATLYEDDGDRFAIKDDTLIVAGSDELLDQALTRAAGSDHLDADAFDDTLTGLPDDALVRTYFDVEGLLHADAGAQDALKVPWIDALRTLALTANVKSDSIDVDFDLETEGNLTDKDLPIAPGGASPAILDRNGDVNVGLRDLSQVIRFAENAGQSISPSGFGQYAQGKQQLDTQLGIDLDRDLIAQLSGDVSANISLNGSFGVRAELKDPAAFKRTLAKIAPVLPDVAKGAGFGTVGLAKPKGNQGFYALANPNGASVVFGVIGDVFVLANDPRRASQLATGNPVSVDGAKGALVLKADASKLVTKLLGAIGDLGIGQLGGGLIAGPLRDLTGSVESSTAGLKGHFSLSLE
jgi:hypothetical protein